MVENECAICHHHQLIQKLLINNKKAEEEAHQKQMIVDKMMNEIESPEQITFQEN